MAKLNPLSQVYLYLFHLEAYGFFYSILSHAGKKKIYVLLSVHISPFLLDYMPFLLKVFELSHSVLS